VQDENDSNLFYKQEIHALKHCATTYVKMRSLDMPAAVRKQEKEKMDFVIEKYQLYVRGDITRSQYIRYVAYKYPTRTDL
jgi:hypothetical protein